MANLTPKEDRQRRALITIMRALGVKDQSLGDAIGLSRSALQFRRSGVKLRDDQIEEMAAALGVPYPLFDLEVPDILRWLADHRSDEVSAASGWFSGFPEIDRRAHGPDRRAA